MAGVLLALQPSARTIAGPCVRGWGRFVMHMRHARPWIAAAITAAMSIAAPADAATRPAPPMDIVATRISPTQVRLTWRYDDPNVTRFTIDRSVNPRRRFHRLADLGGDQRSFVDGSVTPGVAYYYRMRAY